MSTLHLCLEPDLDGAGELHATAVSGDFSGRASAWFSLAALQAFGSALNDNFPLAPGKRLELEGGVWGSSEPPMLLDVQVGLAVYAIGTTGTIGIRVTLATALHDHQRHDCRCSVALALTTDHESLRAFGLAISSMARGWTHEALLHGHAL